MGGGKSRGICEEAFDLALEYPGLKALICRQRHTSIIETTKKTMVEEVLPLELLDPKTGTKRKESGGEDYIRLPNGSTFHFVGLEDPIRWFSSNLGLLVFDEGHEISEDTVVKLITRLRQVGMPCRVIVGFNPENPGHWLQRWFILGASRTEHGYYKRELWTTGATAPIGDAEFVFAKATDNPYLPGDYVESTLGGLPEVLRRRYLEGEWLYTSGTSFFDTEALTDYQRRVTRPKWVGYTAGADDRLLGAITRHASVPERSYRGKVRLSPGKEGPWSVWKTPLRERWHNGDLLPAHRYVASVDVSSGGSTDFSAIQVLDVDAFEQVAEYQAKIDPDLLAVEAYRIGLVYNRALLVPEVTGGWGFTIVKELQRLRYPRLYTRPIDDRLSRKFTSKLGWDTNRRTRAVMLDTLERVLREGDLELHGERTLAELVTFVRDDNDRPAAQPGCNDDLVITLAIAVHIALQLPKQLRRAPEPEYAASFPATGM